MYICICNAITEKQLEDAQKTAKTFKDVCKTLGLGNDCGACIQDAYQISQKSLKTPKADPKNNK
jgi:bacterioferritin-associated ferredoxin